MFEAVCASIKERFRAGDVRQACHNVLDHLKQPRPKQPEPASERPAAAPNPARAFATCPRCNVASLQVNGVLASCEICGWPGERIAGANSDGAQPEATELDKQLRRALHSFSEAADRWAERRQTGLSNAELSEAIGQEFGKGGASGPGDDGYSCMGGKNPRLWLGTGWQEGKPVLQGAALRDAVRELLRIPYPSYSRQLEMQAATEAAHERNLLLLSQTAGPATSDALALEQVRKLQVQAIERFNRIIETTIIEDLEAINALLEDFELDTPPEK